MSGLRKGMVGFLGLVFVLFSYNILSNRPLRKLRTGSEQVQVATALQMKLWGRPSQALEPCWIKPSRKISTTRKEWGYVLVTCSHGPHHHRFQIANAVVVARQLGATLVMPTIKEGLTELASNFDDIYNVKHFIARLEGVVRVMGRLPEELRKDNQTSIEIPYTVTKAYIEQTIRPVFEANQVIVLDRFLPSMKDVKEERDAGTEAVRCLVKHQALLFLSQIEKLGNRLNSRMKEAAQKSGGKYIAVDYRAADKLCDQKLGDSLLSKQRCLPPHDLGLLLQSHGFPPETAIYLTQTRLDESFDPLLSLYPNVVSKEYTMPFNEENQFLYTGRTQFELAVDFHMCSQSEVFVPINSGIFYTAVAGERIRQGLTHMLVPSLHHSRESSEPILTLGASQLVAHKAHPAYSCFCEKGMTKRPARELEKAVEPSSETSD